MSNIELEERLKYYKKMFTLSKGCHIQHFYALKYLKLTSSNK